MLGLYVNGPVWETTIEFLLLPITLVNMGWNVALLSVFVCYYIVYAFDADDAFPVNHLQT